MADSVTTESNGPAWARDPRRPPPSRSSQLVRWIVFLGIGALLIALLARQRSGPTVGVEAATFALPAVGAAEGTFDLASRRGNPVLIEIFASWCPTCESASPTMARAFQAKRERPVCFVGVTMDKTVGAAAKLKNDWNIPYTVAVDDGTVAKAYQVSMLPTFVVLDAEGTVRHVFTGVPDRSDVEGWLASVGAASLR